MTHSNQRVHQTTRLLQQQRLLLTTDNHFNKLESELGTIKGELSALKMMVGIAIALNMAIIGLIVNTIITR